ncbi:valine--tRNA ligase [Yoonia sp.]|jgi:valyl-tRNA synthetase|uniref:valine--tRNA ligase n=1 Tax=Yoonia sp. TaxID=2212373 RepID=UPI0025E02BBB|nr:valine--tRNA ligase [Yoonia sp.]
MEKTFDATTAEPRIYDMWEKAGAFKAGANASRDETFCIMLPPPNVTGFLHVGHAFNHTLMDILTRWKRMQGYDTLWQPGLDHAGIATQLVVEKQLAEKGEKRTDYSRKDFITKIWEWKETSGGMIQQQDKRLGAGMDWDRSAFTMDENFHDAVIKVFVDMYNKGFIYRGKRLVNWDPHFETAISDLEVENIEVDGHMWHFKYPLAGDETYEYVEKDEDGNVTLRETRDYIAIATTRPETMLGDGAVAVHPDDTRYAPIVGKLCEIPVGPKAQRRLIPIITDEYPDMTFGSGAVKITGAHDFNDYGVAKRNDIPLYALMDTKGAMRADGLPYAEAAAQAQAIAQGGAAPADTTPINLVPDDYRGLDRMEARAKVIADITAEGLAVMIPNPALADANDEVPGEDPAPPAFIPYVEAKKIMQPFGDRSKVVIEPMLTDQWFVDTDQIVGPALDAVRTGQVKIMPESGEKVYYHWLENIEPWCISRQLWWGHQIPVWYGLDLGVADEHNPSGELDEVELLGLLLDGMVHRGEVMHCGADFDSVKSSFVFDNADIPSPLSHASVIEVADKAEAMERFSASLAEYTVTQDPTHLVFPVWRDPDVLDTWFSSGLWPFGTLGWPENTPELQKYFPGDVLITGQDILFFWVARMMMMSNAVMDTDPFHTVYLHQLLRDAKGEKMSKTRGNVIDPLVMIDAYGADALRFANAQMAAMGGVLKISEDRIKGYRNFGTKLWNACRFGEMNGVFDTQTVRTASVQDLHATHTVNRWIIGETAKTLAQVNAALESYRFNDAANALYAFVWGKVCDWYVEFSKPMLLDGNETEKSETQATMAWVIDQCLIMLHPIMPFITEELWQTLGKREKMLVHTDWPTYQAADLVDENADLEMNWVINLIESTRSARAQVHVPAGAKVPLLVTGLDTRGQSAWDNNSVLIQRLARIQSLTRVDSFPKGCVTIPMDGGTFGLPLADLIDVKEEIARLEKSMQKLGKELGGLRGRLNNPNFATSAPDDVVAEARENLRLREEEEAQIKAAIARLQEIG